MISIYGRVLSAIEKTLWELVEKYQDIRKSLWNLVKGQKRNTAKLERIGAAVEWRWGLEEENKKKKSRDDEKGFENSSGES